MQNKGESIVECLPFPKWSLDCAASKSEVLTVERLNEVAIALAGEKEIPPPSQC